MKRRLRLLTGAACSITLAAGVLTGTAAAGSAPAPQGDSPASSWPTFHGDPGLTGVSADTAISTANASQLGVAWMTNIGAASFASPVTAFDAGTGETLAYVADTSGNLEALNTADGSIVWSHNFGVPIYSSPTVHGSDVWVGTFTSGHMYKLNAFTGAIDCSVSLGTGGSLSSPLIATPPGGVTSVYFGEIDNGVVSSPIVGLKESDCSTEWSTAPFRVESGTWAPTAYGVAADGTPLVLIGTANSNSTIYAVNAKTGALVWSYFTNHPNADVGSGMTVSPPGDNGFADGMTYNPGADGFLYAFDLTTGAKQWTFDYRDATTPSTAVGGRSSASLVGNVLVFGTDTGVMAVDASTGTEIWDSAHTVAPDTDIVSSPLVTGPAGQQVVVYGDLNGAVKVLSLATGALLYSFQTHGYIMSSPADVNGQIIITSSDGYAYDLQVGGTNSTSYPSTTLTSPANGSTLTNPNSATSTTAPVTMSGGASTADPSPHALVAVQQNGPTGSWWNATIGQWQNGLAWNQAVVTPASGSNSTWTIQVPVGRGGAVWHVIARSVDSNGLADPTAGGAQSVFTISSVKVGPRLKTPLAWTSPGTQITASGYGFSAGETVQVDLGGTASATATASSTGKVTARVAVDRKAPYGLYAIVATGQTSGLTATTPLHVTSPWKQLGSTPDRLGYLPNDFAFVSVLVPDKIHRMQAPVVYNTGAPISSSPAVANMVAYVATGSGRMDAVSTLTGGLLWKTAIGTSAITSSPALDLHTNVLVVGSSDGNVYELNTQAGAVMWKTNTGGPVSSSPNIVNGVVYVGSDAGKLLALNETTGAIEWSTPMAAPGTSSPAVDASKNLVIIGDSSGMVTAFSTGGTTPAGTAVWSRPTGGAVPVTPIVHAGSVYIGSNDGNEYSLSEANGLQQWSTPLGGTPSATATLYNGDLLVGSSNGDVYDLVASSGAVNWADSTPGAVTGLSSTSGLVYAESADGTVTGYRPGHGEQVWVRKTGAGLSTTPSVCDNAVVIGGGDTALYVFTPYGVPMV